jgi:hypothetical protein
MCINQGTEFIKVLSFYKGVTSMKRTLLVVAALGLFSTGAFASKARYASLGNFAVVDDQRETLVNPAKFNMFKNFVITEWGTPAGAPNAEGGAAMTAAGMVWALYLNNNYPVITNNAVTNAEALLDETNSVELSVAGDMGFQWGATLHLGKGNAEGISVADGTTKIDQTVDTMGLKLGAILMKDLEVYGNFDLKYDSKKDPAMAALVDEKAAKYSATGYTLGAKYAMGEYKAYATVLNNKNETTTAQATTIKDKSKDSQMTIGIGRKMEIDNKAKLFADLHLFNRTQKTNVEGNAAETTIKTFQMPIGLGMEVEALTWLVLRGSVSQVLPYFNTRKVKTPVVVELKNSVANTTAINAGFGFTYGDLKVDGTFTTAAAGTLRFDTFGSNVSVSYWF